VGGGGGGGGGLRNLTLMLVCNSGVNRGGGEGHVWEEKGSLKRDAVVQGRGTGQNKEYTCKKS